jgi:choline transport protein
MTIGNAMYAFASTDAVIHVAEEMHNPGRAIPRAMLVECHHFQPG